MGNSDKTGLKVELHRSLDMFEFFMSYIVLNDMHMKPFGCGISVYSKLVDVNWLY